MAADDQQKDDQTPLLSKAQAGAKKGNKTLPVVIEDEIETWSRFLNPRVSRKPWRLFEWCDLGFFPEFLTNKAQAVLTAQWATKLPIIQSKMPAARAAAVVEDLLDELNRIDDSKISVVDLCAGSGGPIPVMERLVNRRRTAEHKSPVPFVLADLHPHLDAWIDVCSHSANLSFLPNKCDATDPPPAATSITTPESSLPDQEGTASATAKSRIVRLYNLSFHHFDDAAATNMLASTLSTADAFGIIELQDRRLFSQIMMLLDVPLIFAGSIFWHWRDPVHLFFTYIVPIMPFLMSFDGVVSSLRTRDFDEILALVDRAMEMEGHAVDVERQGTVRKWKDGEGRRFMEAKRGRWVFRSIRECHTWPIGYMNAVVGWKEA